MEVVAAENPEVALKMVAKVGVALQLQEQGGTLTRVRAAKRTEEREAALNSRPGAAEAKAREVPCPRAAVRTARPSEGPMAMGVPLRKLGAQGRGELPPTSARFRATWRSTSSMT
jgi:hypothetical protein